ncbi:hypothetical protein BZA05DRAFT_417068 [Tricharina praecox]|uniref:uncharacterized protein n=1 Tax=Tricharina praecox TaxID=43433 RepID=UPI00221F388D|nr:uncharacterized protein BZA05DRAFT_417068 [Tricharina praecox]KAI5855510.1 hypothetical protein BZA05DRAFT_417068 [Tricharina praecox]
MPWDGANPTKPVNDPLGWTPLPTEAPFPLYGGEMVPMPGKHIFARAFSDQLCGYISNDSGRPWTCEYSLATCTTGSGVLGCCYPESDTTVCGFRTACIGSAAQASCGVSCLSNTLMRKCTDSTAPFCILYTVPSDTVSVWGCTSTAGLTQPVAMNAAITIPKATSVEVVSRTAIVFASSDIGVSPASGSASASLGGAVTEPTSGGGGGKSNVGAIAGGVVGGLAVIVVGALGIFLVLSRRKKRAAIAAAAAVAPNHHVPYQPDMPAAQQPMLQHQQPPMQQPMYSGGSYSDQPWNNQVYAAPPPQMMHPQQQQQESFGYKYQPSELPTPVSAQTHYDSQSPAPYHQPEQQHGYYGPPQQQYNGQPQQQYNGPPPTELPERY